jgi:Fanconi anemia group M protein
MHKEDITNNSDNNKSNLNYKKILIFSQYRDTLETITKLLDLQGIQCRGFYGQSNKKDHKGLNQDKQISILEDFKNDIFPVLVATSVAEEGLDIPNVDLVIFYEPVPSEIRFIQRRGRTGRFSDGKVVVLVSNDSIDSKYLEIAQKKILKMKHNLKDINLILHQQDKRSFDIPERMSTTDIDSFNQSTIRDPEDNTNKEIFNPIVNSIVSNSNRKIKYFMNKLSYGNKDFKNQTSFSVNDLEHLYDASLSIDSQKMVEKAQRKIHDLLAKAGIDGLEISYINEMTKFDHNSIEKAIKNLEKLKRIVWLNKKTIVLTDTIKFIPGKKYSISIEKVLLGKAIVIINEKWYASLEYFDYFGPKTLLKKGNIFNIIGDTYKKNGTLHLIVKKTM